GDVSHRDLPSFPTRRSSDLFALMGGVIGAKLGMLFFLGPGEFWRLLPTLPAHGAAWAGAFTGGLFTASLFERLYGMERCIGDLADRKSTRLNSSHVKISYAV